jgi:hypothetical protein
MQFVHSQPVLLPGAPVLTTLSSMQTCPAQSRTVLRLAVLAVAVLAVLAMATLTVLAST